MVYGVCDGGGKESERIKWERKKDNKNKQENGVEIDGKLSPGVIIRAPTEERAG